MATSTLEHYVRFGETSIDSLDPVDSGLSDRALGNLNHVADQYAQRRIGWVLWGSNYFTHDADITVPANEYSRVWTSTPFDLHVRPDSTTYSCRVRLRVSSNHATATATFRATLAARGDTEGESYRAGVNVAEIQVTQTGYTWEQGASLIYLDTPRMRRAQTIEPAPVKNTVSGAVVSGTWLRAQLVVWAAVESGASPRLSGLELDEFIPP
jgi:hypothetical protein